MVKKREVKKKEVKKKEVKKKEVKKTDTMASSYDIFKNKFPLTISTKKFSTGSLSIDKVLGGNGIPEARVVELCSPAGLGKSTIAMEMCHFMMKTYGMGVAYIDFENAVNMELLEGIGISVHLNKLLNVHQACNFTDLQTLMDHYINHPVCKIIVIDSITTVKPDKLDEVPIHKIEPALHARLVTSFYMKYKSQISQKGKIVIIINQVRTRISFTSGTREVPAGGKAQEFFPDIRIMLQKMRDIWSDRKERDHLDGAFIEGVDLGIWTIKNKFSIPFIKAVVPVLFGKGISNVRCLFLYAKEAKYFKHHSQGLYDIKFPSLEESRVEGIIGVEEWIRDNYNDVVKVMIEEGWF